jgi:biopolymer transport protein TolR
VAYGTVVRVMGEIKAAGIDRLGIVAQELRDETGRKKK